MTNDTVSKNAMILAENLVMNWLKRELRREDVPSVLEIAIVLDNL